MRSTTELGYTVYEPDVGEEFELDGMKFKIEATPPLKNGEHPVPYHACDPCVLRRKMQCLAVQCYGHKRQDGINVHVVHA